MRKPANRAPSAGPPPGAPQTTSAGLLVGVYATATIDAITVLHLFDWEVRLRQSSVEVTAHGDEWEVHVPLRQGWTGRARGYMTRSAAAADTYIGETTKLSASPAVLTFAGYSDYGTTKIFEGTCLWEDIVIQVPNAMVEQEITLRGNTAPTTGPAA